MLIRPGQIGRLGSTKRFAQRVINNATLSQNIVFAGDSWVLPFVPFYTDTYANSRPDLTIVNQAQGGRKITDSQGNGLVQHEADVIALKPYIYHAGIGRNDLMSYASAQAWFADFTAHLQRIKAALPGVQVSVETLTPRGDTNPAAYNARRLDANTLIRASLGGGIIDSVVDFAAESLLGVEANWIPTTAVTSDGLHLDGHPSQPNTGTAHAVTVFSGSMNALVASTPKPANPPVTPSNPVAYAAGPSAVGIVDLNNSKTFNNQSLSVGEALFYVYSAVDTRRPQTMTLTPSSGSAVTASLVQTNGEYSLWKATIATAGSYTITFTTTGDSMYLVAFVSVVISSATLPYTGYQALAAASRASPTTAAGSQTVATNGLGIVFTSINVAQGGATPSVSSRPDGSTQRSSAAIPENGYTGAINLAMATLPATATPSFGHTPTPATTSLMALSYAPA